MSGVESGSVPDALGRKLMREWFERDWRKGGKTAALIGSKGLGKSTFMTLLAEESFNKGDIVIWRGRHRDLWPALPPLEKKIVLIPKGAEIKVLRFKGPSARGEDITDRFEIKEYSSAKEAFKLLDPEALNVIYSPVYYTPNYLLKQKWAVSVPFIDGTLWWFEFLRILIKRPDTRWFSVFWDELHDLVPMWATGVHWRVLQAEQSIFADFRGALINFVGATHDPSLLDPRFRWRNRWYFYFNGARPAPGSIVWKFLKSRGKNVIDWLELGTVIVENLDKGKSGVFEFRFPKTKYMYRIQLNQDSPVDDGVTIAPRQANKRGGSIKDRVFALANEKGVDFALSYVEELYHYGKISERYFYKLKKQLRTLS